MSLETRRWLNQSQPQTLQIAVFLLYLDAVFGLLFGGFRSIIALALIAGSAAAGYGIANDKKWGYRLGVTVSAVPMLFYVLYFLAGFNVLRADPVGVIFNVAQLALLLHPQSREYQRIWFT